MQTSIAAMQPAIAGQIADASRRYVRTAVSEEASAEMPFGVMLKAGTGKAGALNLTAIYVPLVVADFTFTATNATDTLNANAHGLETGDGPVRVSNSGGALPTGLAGATDYWVIKTGVNTFKLATSLANALAGTAINITTDGTGTQTLSDTAGTERNTPYKLLGVHVHGHAYHQPEQVGDVGVKPKTTIGVMHRGTIWVVTEGTAPTKLDEVHVRAEASGNEVAGAFRATADGTDTYDLSDFCTWTGRVGTNIAELEVDLTNCTLFQVA